MEERSWKSLSTWVGLLRQSWIWSVSRKAALASALCLFFTMFEYFYETPSAWEQRHSSRARRTQQNQGQLCYFGMESKAFLLAWSLLAHSLQPDVDFLSTWCTPLLLGPNGSLGGGCEKVWYQWHRHQNSGKSQTADLFIQQRGEPYITASQPPGCISIHWYYMVTPHWLAMIRTSLWQHLLLDPQPGSRLTHLLPL